MQDHDDAPNPYADGRTKTPAAGDHIFACRKCGYNLDGLDFAGTCPECNTPVLGACAHCGYDLAGLDLADSCPECNTPVLKSCFHCGYDLAGIDPMGFCPECGVRAVHSIGRGPFAAFPRETLETIRKGFDMALAAVILYALIIIGVMIVGMVVGFSVYQPNNPAAAQAATRPFNIASSIIGTGFTILFIVGWWRLTETSDRLPDTLDRPELRKGTRVLLVVAAVLSVVGVVGSLVASPQGTLVPTLIDWVFFVVGIVSLGVWIGLWVFQLLYLKWFAKMVRNTKMHGRAKHLIWSGPVIGVLGALCLMIGPLIVLVLYWNTLYYLRRDIKRLCRDARAAGA